MMLHIFRGLGLSDLENEFLRLLELFHNLNKWVYSDTFLSLPFICKGLIITCVKSRSVRFRSQ